MKEGVYLVGNMKTNIMRIGQKIKKLGKGGEHHITDMIRATITVKDINKL